MIILMMNQFNFLLILDNNILVGKENDSINIYKYNKMKYDLTGKKLSIVKKLFLKQIEKYGISVSSVISTVGYVNNNYEKALEKEKEVDRENKLRQEKNDMEKRELEEFYIYAKENNINLDSSCWLEDFKIWKTIEKQNLENEQVICNIDESATNGIVDISEFL